MGTSSLDTFITTTLGLTKLPPFLPTFFYSFVGFSVVHLLVAPWVSRKWFPEAYGSKNKRAQNTWSIHIVSQAHALLIVTLTLWALSAEPASHSRAFGWDERVGYTHAVACGYFLWDSLDAIVNFTDVGFVVHGVACLFIYVMSFRPFVAYYGLRCLLWETSTFFLNIHWFMDKTGRTGSTAQFVNGIFLLSAFFGVRLMYGGKVSFDFMCTLIEVRHEMPWGYIFVFGVGNIVLTGLNWFWFTKMISALRRRFDDDKNGERRRLVTTTHH
ncbi:hypothetical protein C0995_014293 [Termitomyces sp. Mi166|nr:hypothetical protein C0995_014293 [Termitomyces sp. Mi166\